MHFELPGFQVVQNSPIVTILWGSTRTHNDVPCKLTRIIRLHRMHDMQTIVTDVRGVCLSACHVAQLNFTVWGHSVQSLPNYNLSYLVLRRRTWLFFQHV